MFLNKPFTDKFLEDSSRHPAFSCHPDFSAKFFLEKSSTYLIIEEMKTSWYKDSRKQNLPYSGGLNSTRWQFIKRVHIIEPAMAQFYAAQTLKYSVHYSVNARELKKLVATCKRYEKPFTQYSVDKTYINDFLCVINEGTEEFALISDLIEELNMLKMAESLIATGEMRNGLFSESFGASAQNQTREGAHVTRPRIQVEDNQRQQLVLISQMCRILSKEVSGFPQFIVDMELNPDRLDACARKIHPKNLFEAAANLAAILKTAQQTSFGKKYYDESFGLIVRIIDGHTHTHTHSPAVLVSR